MTDESFHAWMETEPEIRRLGTLGHDIAKAAWVAGMRKAMAIIAELDLLPEHHVFDNWQEGTCAAHDAIEDAIRRGDF